LESVRLTADSFIVLITTDHVSDESALWQVIHSPVRYSGDYRRAARGQDGARCSIKVTQTNDICPCGQRFPAVNLA